MNIHVYDSGIIQWESTDNGLLSISGTRMELLKDSQDSAIIGLQLMYGQKRIGYFFQVRPIKL